MIREAVFRPARDLARQKTIQVREICAKSGMVGVLEEFSGEGVSGRSRRMDGLSDLDAAVTALRRNWKTQGGAGTLNERATETLLAACAAWIMAHPPSSNHARFAAVRELYWKVAWAYSCDNYVQRALETIAACRRAGTAAAVIAPVQPTSVLGNPYHYTGSCGYVSTDYLLPAPLLRGDTRGPKLIHDSGGFMPRDIQDRWLYLPFWSGMSSGHTISTTAREELAIKAGPAAAKGALRTATAAGEVPRWVDDICGQIGRRREGFVYELAGLDRAAATRRSIDPVDLELVFLAIPKECITRWWVVLNGNWTLGPFPYQIPLPTTAPAYRRSEDRTALA